MKVLWSAVIAALLLAGAVLAVACGGGSSSNLTAVATQAADATPSASLTITAQSLKYDTKLLVVPAGQDVTIHMDNKDSGVLHNFSVYTDKSAKTNLFRGETFQGSASRDFAFKSPPAGVYYFRCDVHPDMNGTFVSK